MTYRWPLLYWGPVRTGNVLVTGPPILGPPSVQLDTLMVVHRHRPAPGVRADTGHFLELVSDVTGGGTGTPVSQLPFSDKNNVLLEITILLIDIRGNQQLFVTKKILWHLIELYCSKIIFLIQSQSSKDSIICLDYQHWLVTQISFCKLVYCWKNCKNNVVTINST